MKSIRPLLTVQTLVALLFTIMITGCASLNKLYNSGRYDEVMDRSIRKLEHNPGKDKYISYLEKAYAQVYQRDMDHINYLKKEGNPANSYEIYQTYLGIRQHYNWVKPLLPLHHPGHDAGFQDVSDEDLIAAKNKAAEYLYAHAMQLIQNNNRPDARKAFDELTTLKTFFDPYKDVDHQLAVAHALGVNHVLFKMQNGSQQVLPADFDQELRKIDIAGLNTTWLEYSTQADTGVFCDYYIVANIQNIEVSPEGFTLNHYTDTRQVEDGWEYVLDDHGHVKKDSLGNEIKKPKYRTISCNVTETVQNKKASLSGAVEYYNNRTHTLIRSIPVKADAFFTHSWAVANGDLNALSPASQQKIKSLPVPYPSAMDLLTQAGQNLKPLVKQAVWDNHGLIEN